MQTFSSGFDLDFSFLRKSKGYISYERKGGFFFFFFPFMLNVFPVEEY